MAGKLRVVLFSVLLGSGPACDPAGRSPVPGARSPQEIARDYAIFDTVLPDLIDNKDFDPAVGGRAVEKREVVLDDATIGGTGAKLLESVERQHEPD